MKEETQELNNICCLCLTENNNSKDIANDEDLHEKVSKIFGVQLNVNDNYPTGACEECIGCLELNWNFRLQVLNSFACLNVIKSATTHETPALEKAEETTIADNISLREESETQAHEETYDFYNESTVVENLSNDDENSMEIEMLHSPVADNSIIGSVTEIDINAVASDEEIVDEPQTSKTEPIKKVLTRNRDKRQRKTAKIEPTNETAFKNEAVPVVSRYKESKYNRTCKVCGKIFPSVSRLQNHKPTHSDAKPFGCKECPMRFKSERNSYNHFLAIHSTHRPNTCEICGKSYARVPDLNKHMRTIHSEKPYKCDVCGRKFFDNAVMEKHRSLHLEKTLYQCELCPESFRSQLKLSTHKLSHDDPSHDQMAAQKANRCEICFKGFLSRSALSMHLVTHAEERPFSCCYCDLTFKVRSTCRAHEKVVHEKILPHKCEICGKGHSRRANLVKHRQVHCERAPAVEEEDEAVIGVDIKYNCDRCSVSFDNTNSTNPAADLRKHNLKHKIIHIRQYCALCHQLFLNEESLLEHREKFHGFQD